MKTIGISYAEVKRDVLRLSEYIGQKSGAYDRVRAIDEDDEQLRKWYAEGLTVVGFLLDRLIARPVSINTVTDITDFVFGEVNDNAALLPDAMKTVIESHMMYKWVKLVAPQLSEAYYNDFAQAKDALVKLSYYREMPQP